MASNQGDIQMSDASPLPISTGADADSESVRKYLNTKVTGVLMEGMKKIGTEKPKDPLRVLGEFLIERSKDLEEST
ncbi:COMPASS component SDC1 [Ceratocystis fimbriata CBS 114723]|uniref:COMPASS component SDC1 n=1 Tax=Ceratocystis fimbriata CBS 114723 TaxID=1035309 RepID=A0A2C5XCK2_9PEZI|nr:COMPASS component SDC1 [Ceratocystis fimbriata CBS 114723]